MLTEPERVALQQNLIALVEELAKGALKEDELQAEAQKVRDIYKPGFRHQYSQLLRIVQEAAEEDSSGRFEVFDKNLDSLKDFLLKDEQTCEEIKERFIKLYDHLKLEIIHWDLFFGKAKGKVTRVEEHYQAVEERYQKLNESLETRVQDAEDRFSRVQTDFVTILGIFAAIVIAFFTGTSYLTSAIAATASAPLEKLTVIAMFCGLILLDELIALMYFIAKLTDRKMGVSGKAIILLNILLFLCGGVFALLLQRFRVDNLLTLVVQNILACFRQMGQ